MNRYLLTAVTSAALLVPATGALANPGELDARFSDDGRALVDFGATEAAHGVALQPDGKIVLAGVSRSGGQDDVLVARLNRDGTPDPSFSGDGRITFSFAQGPIPSNDEARAVALASDGSIVVSGLTDANAGDGNGVDTAVARLTPGGELDPAFDGDGRQTIHYGQDDEGADVAVRGDGAVYVGSTALIGNDNDFGVARLTPGGQPDKSWSSDGRTSTHFGASENLRAIALTPDGGVVAVGIFQNVSTSTDTAVARYLPNGNPDETGFAGRGKVTLSLSGKDGATDVALQRDGKIVIAAADTGKGPRGLVARLTPTGAFDESFSDHGVAQALAGSASDFRALALTAREHIVAVGQSVSQKNPNDFVTAEFLQNGDPDRTYPGGDGIATVDFGGSETARAVAVAGDREIVAGVSGSDIAVAALGIDEDPLPEPAPPAGDPGAPQEGAQAAVPPATPAPAADSTAPVLSKLKLKAARGTEKGTFKLSEQATVKVTVQRKVKRGRRTRLVAARTITLKGKPGANAFKLRKLKPGRYRVTLKATDGAGNASKAVRKAFVLKKKRR